MADAVTAANPIGIQDFLRILVAQLNYQDPLKPMDSQQFVTQLAQFTSLQQTQEINQQVSSILAGQSAMQSVGLLGHSVDLSNANGAQTGTVTALTFTNGVPSLTVKLGNGSVVTDVTLASITSIR